MVLTVENDLPEDRAVPSDDSFKSKVESWISTDQEDTSETDAESCYVLWTDTA